MIKTTKEAALVLVTAIICTFIGGLFIYTHPFNEKKSKTISPYFVMWQSKDSDIPTMYAAQTHNEACVRSEEHKNENPGVLRYEDMGGEFMFAHYVYCTKKEIFVDEAPEAK